MKFLAVIIISIAFTSCSNEFINHKLKVEKLGACTDENVPIKMLSNIAGERYEFVSCLDADFDEKNYEVTRQGDSIIVSFPQKNSPNTAYKLTIDIDAKPAYRHIILDGKELLISPQE